MLKVTTTYNTHPTSGASRITAKGYGSQRTVSYDPALSPQQNHLAAATALLVRLEQKGMTIPLFPRSECVEHDKGKATFVFGEQ